MASVMVIFGGLVKPKIEIVKKPLVLLLFFEGPKRPWERVAPPKMMALKPFWGWKLCFVQDVGKNRLSKMCFLPWRGAHFHKTNEKMMRKYKKWS